MRLAAIYRRHTSNSRRTGCKWKSNSCRPIRVCSGIRTHLGDWRRHVVGLQVEDQQLERWQELCAQAAAERDPKKFMNLIHEIERLLELKEERLLREKTHET